MYVYTCNNWSYQNSKKNFKERFESHTSKIFNIFTTKTAILGISHMKGKVLQSET
jgi:hypothetical protein